MDTPQLRLPTNTSRVWRHLIASAWLLCACVPCMLAYAGAPTARTAPQTEAEAIAAGEHLGIGHVRMNGPSEVPVMTFQSWTFTYTAGRASIKPGGRVRLRM
jgi:hypothetical protein